MSAEDLNFVMLLFNEIGWYGAEICRQFPSKMWNPRTLNYNLNKMKNTGSIQRKPGSGQNLTVCTGENETVVSDFACSQDSEPGAHESQRKLDSQSAQVGAAYDV